jgi:hypothetical protein
LLSFSLSLFLSLSLSLSRSLSLSLSPLGALTDRSCSLEQGGAELAASLPSSSAPSSTGMFKCTYSFAICCVCVCLCVSLLLLLLFVVALAYHSLYMPRCLPNCPTAFYCLPIW